MQYYYESYFREGIVNIFFDPFKVNGDMFRGSNFVIFTSGFLLNGGQLLKDRICSYGSKFNLLRADPILGRSSSQESTQEDTKVVCL